MENEPSMGNRKDSEVLFLQENVAVCISGPLKEDATTNGIIRILREDHGHVVEWHPGQQIVSSGKLSPSRSDTSNSDWEDVSAAVIGHKAEKEGTVEIKTSGTTTAKPICFDVSDINSFKRIEKVNNEGKIDVVIFTVLLKDGTNIPSFYFESLAVLLQFILALEKLVTIKRSTKDNTLFLVNDHNVEALEKSFSELELFDENKTHIVTKFLHNPVDTAMGSFSRVTNIVWGNLDYIFNNGGTGSPAEYSEKQVIEMLHDSLPNVDIDHHEEPGYEFIRCIQMPPRLTMKREEPVTVEEWHSYFNSDGRVQALDVLKQRIFKGGLMHSIRSEAWKFLLGYYSFDSTCEERESQRKKKVDDYYRMKLQWKSIDDDQESRFAAFRERQNLIGKDVSRTDRTHPFFEGENNVNIQMLHDILMTYCMYNFDLGYVQGMSDLLSPILVVMQNEADTFWCFAEWMNDIGINFEMDQQGMKNQLQNLHRLMHFVDSQFCNYLEKHESGNLYFAFRWLLILFKRDFKFQEIMRLWEVLWTNLPCKNFHLLICLAILDTEKLTVMENMYGLTEVLKHINDLAYKINLDATLCKAEAIYYQIIQCSHLSDIVQKILSIELSTSKKTEIPGTAERIVCRKKSETSVASTSHPCEVASPSSATDGMEDIEGYVEVEHQYDIAFGLFT